MDNNIKVRFWIHDACNRMENLNVRHLNTCMQTGWKINKV